MGKEQSKKYQQQSDSFQPSNEGRKIGKSKRIEKRRNGAGRPPKSRKQENQEEHLNTEQLSSSMQSVANLPGCAQDRPSLNIMEVFIIFFNAIGQDRGLVFTQNQRKQLINKAKKDARLDQIKWTKKHQWNQNTQRGKIQNLAKRYHLHLNQKKVLNLVQIMLGTTSIFAQQFTEEVYKLLINIYLILTNEQQQTHTLEKKEKKRFLYQDFSNSIDMQKPIMFQGKIEMQEEQINSETSEKSKLEQLADTVCQNINEEYYLLSFEFKKIKTRASQKKKEQLQNMDKKEAYRTLVKNIYNVMKLQSF